MAHDEVVAPLNAGQPLARVVRAYRAQIDPLLRTLSPARVWLSSGDHVFAHIAAEAERRGAAICFYEDGLSSYRRADDPSFRRVGLGAQAALSARALGQQCGRIGRAARGRQGGSEGVGAEARDLLRKIAVHGELVALASPLRPLFALGDFGARRTKFDEAWVAFPDALDPRVVAARAARAIRPEPSSAEIAAARDAAAGAPPALYVSQTYGNTFDFYEAVAEALAATGETAMTVKHHPREKGLRREALTKALARRGVRAEAPAALDGPPAEALFAAGSFRPVYGLTSTALLLGRAADPDLDVRPIGRAMERALRRDPASLWRYDRFFGDLSLFDSLWARRVWRLAD
ncbi:MAG: polysialyltransferase family glycosyltransferase [Pseudomonadota bacterium]